MSSGCMLPYFCSRKTQKPEIMKRKGMTLMAAVVIILTLGGCSEMVKDSDNASGHFSLSDIYSGENTSGIRFQTQKRISEKDTVREMVSEKWNRDFLLASEMRNRLDSLK